MYNNLTVYIKILYVVPDLGFTNLWQAQGWMLGISYRPITIFNTLGSNEFKCIKKTDRRAC